MRAGKLKVYRDRKGEWRWFLASPYNGKCIAYVGRAIRVYDSPGNVEVILRHSLAEKYGKAKP